MLDGKHKSSYTGNMNKLPLKTRSLILKMLCEEQSMRATARLADVSFNTVAKLLIDAGAVCARPIPNRLVKTALWVATALVLTALFWSWIAPVLAPIMLGL